ncbi:tautomerase family protein [Salinibacterium sp. dk2585]|uniref:tautomerase family protein n=1 Tax=unclassified Salinibacterium TaxID=2632331 RepID=UPI0011C2428A|nr:MULTISPECIES: tautomerase family protein [unclassified Salinibacterium]QEE61027.1 tautomerase family protein [Salinibacterium sp. dk2585]TXK52969.1 tautomerase family protein [Salinibacterium sp. dk5596]
MPKALVEVRRQYTDDAAAAILDAVHEALVVAFRIPQEDRGARLIEHPPTRFTTPDGLAEPDRYTLVTIDCFAGRSIDAKRHLFAELSNRLHEAVGIPRDHVTVILHEISQENWGTRAGLPASDIDLGFDINV